MRKEGREVGNDNGKCVAFGGSSGDDVGYAGNYGKSLLRVLACSALSSGNHDERVMISS